MDRRKFLKGSALGLIALSTPISLSAAGEATRKVGKSGRLNLSFKPNELKLRHAFNLARSSRTTTPDVLVQLEYDGIIGYGEASMPPYLGESIESVSTFLSKLDLSQFSDPFRIEEMVIRMETWTDTDSSSSACAVNPAGMPLAGCCVPGFCAMGLA